MDPLEVAGGLGIAGLAITTIGALAREIVKRSKPTTSMRPPPSAPKPSVSGQMRAMTETMLRQQQEETMRVQIHEMHRIVTERDQDGAPRVQNKSSVEQAILDTARSCEQQERLLGEILAALRDRPVLPPTTYRKKMPSSRGGE